MAVAFCARNWLGSDIDAAIDQAKREEIRHRALDDGRVHEFIFYGAIFYGNACELSVSDGKVVSARNRVCDD